MRKIFFPNGGCKIQFFLWLLNWVLSSSLTVDWGPPLVSCYIGFCKWLSQHGKLASMRGKKQENKRVRWKPLSFCNLISEGTSQPICCILFVRRVTGSSPYSRISTIYKGINTRSHYRGCLLQTVNLVILRNYWLLFRYEILAVFLKVWLLQLRLKSPYLLKLNTEIFLDEVE